MDHARALKNYGTLQKSEGKAADMLGVRQHGQTAQTLIKVVQISPLIQQIAQPDADSPSAVRARSSA